MIKESCNELKILAESIVGQSNRAENTLKAISNPARFGGLGIKASHLVKESREIYIRREITASDLKTKLINQENTLLIKQDTKVYKRIQ